MNSFSDAATFGVELEFLVLFREAGVAPSKLQNGKSSPPTQQVPEEPSDLTRDYSDDHEAHMQRVHYFGKDIAKKLTDTGTATVYQEKSHPKDEKTLNPSDTYAKLGSFDDFLYSYYKENSIVPEDTMIWTDPEVEGKRMAVRPETPPGHFWLGFEFVGKTYRFRDLDAMKSDFNSVCRTFRTNYLVSVNAGKDSGSASSQCGTHVHWGLSGTEYNLVTIKRILTLMWVAEDKLMELHASWRKYANKYAALLQTGTNMGVDNDSKLPGWIDDLGDGSWVHEMEQNVPPNVWGSLHQNKPKVQWLCRAETVDELAMLVGEPKKSRRASIGLMELLPATSEFPGKVRRSQLNTIEFRQVQGSFKPALVTAWIEVTTTIMKLGVDAPPDDFKESLNDIATYLNNETSTVQGLLDKLRVPREACNIFESHDQRRLDEEADPEISIFLPEL
ncbi:uncharacterized protein F4812DRAFT_459906 [Daldinia caldariorum]|uniref:uncharacterized protein n=1 Tax=Daldinia caldariorum TaxID=326644 RepID=UPI0020081F58|nr:uncharacterized protein F4812DRAFT_459906 [Daldinia caldariorum]KAI1467055.1 hypothetical protein F4812DRAFT_459906 [Daldinia caldariorum]